ncbi:MAG: hypothetical protein EON85_01500 [Brevundimonas sp.]|nr:MAG: hypothetical protein EON85_01500 [Brevundimonas sp.]
MRLTTMTAAVALTVALAGCATADGDPVAATPVAAAAATAEPGPQVTVTRDGDRWTADYVLPSDSPVWAFIRSALKMDGSAAWRQEQWTVETPGVVLERQGHLDILRATDGGPVPRRIRIVMRPASQNLQADYNPAIVFTDGSAALFSGHFELFPVASVETARDMPLDLNEVQFESQDTLVKWRDRAGPVLVGGERRDDASSIGRGTYALFGQMALVDSPRLATVIDPQLPGWISTELAEFAPKVADYYVQRLGPGQTAKPTIMISWNGPTPQFRSMGGSVLSGLIVMTFEGDNVVQASAEMRDHARWFIGHESAHFWLGQTVRYDVSREAWITEGGADLMAVRAQSHLYPAYDARAELQQEVDDCTRLAVQPVASANRRGEHRAYYACGAVFALAAEAAQKRATGGDWFDFLKPLIDANREDGKLSRAEWLDALLQVTGDPDVRREIDTLLDEGAADPAPLIARLFDRTGVAYRMEDGKVRLI